MTDQAWLAYLQGADWLTDAPVQRVRVAPALGGIWSVDPVTVPEAELLAARPAGPIEQIRRFHLLHSGWQVASFQLFRPLVYFAAFGAAAIFDCLQCTISSLVEFGKWSWDVLVLTSPDAVDAVRLRLQPCGLGERLHIAAVGPAANLLDWCMARYRLDAHPLLRTAQPLIYLDTDIVCDKPLEPLLTELVVSSAIHACAEGRVNEGDPNSRGHWFGWRLMVEDGMIFDPRAPGFSSGALGVANAASAHDPYSLILRSAYADAAQVDGGRKLEGQDQPFANYVLRKLRRFDIGLMYHFLTLYRLHPDRPLFPDPTAARGLVHFLGASTATKLTAMEAYCAALRSRRDPASA